MIHQKIIILGISVVLATGTSGFDWMETLFPPAEAHGVQAQLQSRFVIIQNETFDRQSLQTGETLTVSGQLVSLVERDLWGWASICWQQHGPVCRDVAVERDLQSLVSIFSELANEGNRWEIIAMDPPSKVLDIEGNSLTQLKLDYRIPDASNVFDIEGNAVVPYSISAIALEAGVYHVHTLLNVASVGPGIGPGQTVVVEGDPIVKPIPYTDIAYQSSIAGVEHVITFSIPPWPGIGYIWLIFGDLIWL